MEPIRPAAFARLRGISRQRVAAMIRAGLITPPAVTTDGRIRPDVAAAQLAARLKVEHRAATDGLDTSTDALRLDARARREAAQAEIAEMQLGKARAQLVEVASVRQLGEEVAALVRDALQRHAGDELAQAVLGETDLRTVLTAFSVVIDRVQADVAEAADRRVAALTAGAPP